MEWRLYPDSDRPPDWTQPRWFAGSPHVPPEAQRGHSQRIHMVAQLVRDVCQLQAVRTVTDLGCGDGSLLALLATADLDPPAQCWGYDLSTANLEVARRRGVVARVGNILAPRTLQLGRLLVASEVVEHLADPHGWLAELLEHRRLLVVSSPWDETGEPGRHYDHHAWAWDEPGYRDLVEGAGWRVIDQRACPAGFQAIYAVRPGR